MKRFIVINYILFSIFIIINEDAAATSFVNSSIMLDVNSFRLSTDPSMKLRYDWSGENSGRFSVSNSLGSSSNWAGFFENRGISIENTSVSHVGTGTGFINQFIN